MTDEQFKRNDDWLKEQWGNRSPLITAFDKLSALESLINTDKVIPINALWFAYELGLRRGKERYES